jgi:hypothetical protein
MQSRWEKLLLAVLVGGGAAWFVTCGVVWVLAVLTFPLTGPDGDEEGSGWIGPTIFAVAAVVGLSVGALTDRSWYLNTQSRK